MSGDDGPPEAVFATAKAALGVGDLAGAFACFDRADLLKIAGNSVRALSAIDDDLGEACDRFGFDLDSLRDMRQLTDRMAASAALLSVDPASFDSDAHRRMATDYESVVKDGFRTVTDLPGLAAALERRMRTVTGGGSIATSLFAGESLTAVSVDGKKAWATRVEGGRNIDDIGFVRKRDGWKIKLFARRPSR